MMMIFSLSSLEQQQLVENGLSLNNSTVLQVFPMIVMMHILIMVLNILMMVMIIKLNWVVSQ